MAAIKTLISPASPPRWLREPFVLAVPSEGFVFARRSGRPYIVDAAGPESDWSRYRELYSERSLRRLARDGISLLLSFSYFRTMSAEAERDERELTLRAFQTCRRLGLRTGVYIADTINPETIKAAHPDCESWAMRNAQGEPVLYSDEWWRMRWCRNNPDVRAYLKQQVRTAIVDFQVDMIHFDNFMWMHEPQRDCHCPVCKTKFTQYLLSRYTARQRRARYGFADVTHVTPPYRLVGWKPPLRVLDPVHQDWLAFRCASLSAAITDLAGFIRGLNPRVAVECNPLGIDGCNRARTSGVLHDTLLRHTDVFWSEEPGHAELHPDGRLTSFIRSHKLARGTGNKLLCYTHTPLRLAEAMAFGNGSLGCVPWQPDERCRGYIQFYREHFKTLYAAPASRAKVALWRGNLALMLDNYGPHRDAILTEQALITARQLFDIVMDSDLARIPTDTVLVVPGMSVLEEHNESLLAAHLERGGSMLLLGECGTRDERMRCRKRPAFAAELGIRGDYPKPLAQRRLVRLKNGARIAYLPQVVCARHPSREDAEKAPSWWGTTPTYWFTPDNHAEILNTLHWCSGGEPMIEVLAPHGVAMEVTSPHGGRATAVHLVHYGAPQALGDVLVRFRDTLHRHPRRVELHSPDRGRALVLPLNRDGGVYSFQWHGLQTYDVALIR